MDAGGYVYKAFISYRHTAFDKKVADKLQRMLEAYRAPRGLQQGGRWKVFRDDTELPTSNDLSNDIRTALGKSEFLIVVCSKTTAQSVWCRQEISHFKSLHGNTTANIITLLIDGEPSEVFPEELCHTMVEEPDENGVPHRREVPVEPLAGNIVADSERESFRKLRQEFLRIAAPLLGCGYDDLYNRDRRRRTRRISAAVAALFAVVLSFSIYNSAMLSRLHTAYDELTLKNDELNAANDALNQKNGELRVNAAELAAVTAESRLGSGDTRGAIRAILENRPYEDDASRLLPSGQTLLAQALGVYGRSSQNNLLLHAMGRVTYCEYSPDGSRFLAADEGGSIYVWDTVSGSLLFTDYRTNVIERVCFADDARILIAESNYWALKEIETGAVVWEKDRDDLFNDFLTPYNSGCTLTDDHGIMAVTGYPSDQAEEYWMLISFVDVQTGQELYGAQTEPGWMILKDGVFSADGSKWLCACSSLNTGEQAQEYCFIEYDLRQKTHTVIGWQSVNRPEKYAYLGPDRFWVLSDDRQAQQDRCCIDVVGTDGALIRHTAVPVADDVDLLHTTYFDKASFIGIVPRTNYYIDGNQMDNTLLMISYTMSRFFNLATEKVFFENSLDSSVDADDVYLFMESDKYIEIASHDAVHDRRTYAEIQEDGCSILLYDSFENDECVRIALDSTPQSLYVSSQGYCAAIAGDATYVYDTATKERMSTLPGSYGVYHRAFFGYYMAAEVDDIIHVYDVRSGSEVGEYPFDNVFVGPYAFENGTGAVLPCSKGVFLVTENGIREIRGKDGRIYTISDLCFVDEYRNGFLIEEQNEARHRNELAYYDAATGQRTCLLEGDYSTGHSLLTLAAFSGDACCVYSKNQLTVFDPASGDILCTRDASDMHIAAMRYTPDGKKLVAFLENGYLVLLDALTLRQEQSLLLPIVNDSFTEDIAIRFDTADNSIVFTRNKETWFITQDTLEITLDITENAFLGFLPDTDEVVTVKRDALSELNICPHYSSGQLIAIAEKLIQ